MSSVFSSPSGSLYAKRTKVLIGTDQLKELVQSMFYLTCNWLSLFHNLLLLLQSSTIFAQSANFASKIKVLLHYMLSFISKSNTNLAGCKACCNENLGGHSAMITQNTLGFKNRNNCVEINKLPLVMSDYVVLGA